MGFGEFGRLPAFLAAGLIFLFLAGAASSEGLKPAGSVQSINRELCDGMRRRHTLNGVFPSCERLRLVRFSFVNFRGERENDGSIVVLDAVANQVLLLFEDLRLARFPIEKAKLMSDYDGDDEMSMDDNNTSSFNDRKIAGSNKISMHAYGAAIDINPKINPFVVRNGTSEIVKPVSGAAYLNRSVGGPGTAEPVRAIFANHGFVIWGGAWHNPVDYQHFQLSRSLAEKLIALQGEQAREYFESYVQAYRTCIAGTDAPPNAAAAKCGEKPAN